MTTESEYEAALIKLKSYSDSREQILNCVLNGVPKEMAMADFNILMDALHDGLSDAYLEITQKCNDIIEAYERKDTRDAENEHKTVGK